MCNCNDKSQIKSVTNTIISGSIGIMKSITGHNYVNSATISKRRNICKNCEKNYLGICSECKCVILLKTTQSGQQCPLNYW